MRKFFIAVTQKAGKETVTRDVLVSYEAKLDIWHSMAYFVARELHMRPYYILTEWTCEELLVAYGEYANIHSAESYETRMSFFRKEKPKKPSLDEKYAVIFLTRAELEEMNAKKDDEQDKIDLADLARSFFG